MTTRSKRGIHKLNHIISLLTQTQSHLPKNHLQALEDPFWNDAMYDEYGAIVESCTFDLVPHPHNVKIVTLYGCTSTSMMLMVTSRNIKRDWSLMVSHKSML